ncbi:hypothetical protein PMY12_13045 [Clostridium tertium]|nr:hypothetical protein [Clostridium tertium]MDB1934687.1 hypothetical protein [Clostridium tertium]MDB1937934.1 hypothetical protein [Clostridium tertium]
MAIIKQINSLNPKLERNHANINEIVYPGIIATAINKYLYQYFKCTFK